MAVLFSSQVACSLGVSVVSAIGGGVGEAWGRSAARRPTTHHRGRPAAAQPAAQKGTGGLVRLEVASR